MADHVTIFWPDAPLASELAGTMTSRGFARDPQIVVSYPSVAGMNGALSADNAPQVVVVGLTEQKHALALIHEISHTRPEIVVAAADCGRESDAVVAAMRAGAIEFLAPPFDLQYLQTALSKRFRGGATAPVGRLTAVLPARGGSGASMVAVHLANSISLISKSRVLVVDFDFQAGSIAFRFGVNPEFTLADALARIDMVDELWQRLAFQREGFEVLAAPTSFKSMSPENLSRLPQLFSSALRTYRHIVVDMPPAMFAASQFVLDLASQVYLVTTPEVVALHLARRRASELVEAGVPKDHVRLIVNRFDRQQLRAAEIEQSVGLPVAHLLRNDYPAVTAAALKGIPLDPHSGLGLEVHSLARTIAGEEICEPAASGWKKLLGF